MDARSHTIRLRVNDVEKAQIEGAAAGRGLGVSAYLRGCHAAVLRGEEMPSVDSSDPTDRLAAKLTARPAPRTVEVPAAAERRVTWRCEAEGCPTRSNYPRSCSRHPGMRMEPDR